MEYYPNKDYFMSQIKEGWYFLSPSVQYPQSVTKDPFLAPLFLFWWSLGGSSPQPGIPPQEWPPEDWRVHNSQMSWEPQSRGKPRARWRPCHYRVQHSSPPGLGSAREDEKVRKHDGRAWSMFPEKDSQRIHIRTRPGLWPSPLTHTHCHCPALSWARRNKNSH